jgi:dGTP triphosphohydrolase
MQGETMKRMLLACVTVAAFAEAAPAQDLPTLSRFLITCSRESEACRVKMKDYVRAAVSQHSMCLPKDVSDREAISEILDWLRDDNTHPESLNDAPYDDAIYAATQKLYPCEPPQEQPQQQPTQPPPQ